MNVLPYEGDDDKVSGMSFEDGSLDHTLLREKTEKAILSNYRERRKKEKKIRSTNHARLNKQLSAIDHIIKRN